MAKANAPIDWERVLVEILIAVATVVVTTATRTRTPKQS